MRPLTTRQQRFVDELLTDVEGNATQAAKRAGFKGSDKSLGVTASKLLASPKIAAVVAERRAALAKRTDMTAEDVVQELKDQLSVDLGQIIHWNNDDAFPIPLEKLTIEQRRAIKSIQLTRDKEGNPQWKVELHDRERLLDMVARHLGFYPKEAPVVQVQNNYVVVMPSKEKSAKEWINRYQQAPVALPAPAKRA